MIKDTRTVKGETENLKAQIEHLNEVSEARVKETENQKRKKLPCCTHQVPDIELAFELIRYICRICVHSYRQIKMYKK